MNNSTKKYSEVRLKLTIVIDLNDMTIWLNEALQRQMIGDNIISQDQSKLIALDLIRSMHDRAFPDAQVIKVDCKDKMKDIASLENHSNKVIRNAASLALELMDLEDDGNKYSCPNCDWEGYYIELIQAGPTHELCPECETLIQ